MVEKMLIAFGLAALVATVPAQDRAREDRADPALIAAEGFEAAKSGPFETLTTAVGRWSAESGHAEIDPHHRHGGRQCLHIFGGADRSVELVPSVKPGVSYRLSFWAERWTARKPFAFRIEGLRHDEWRTLYDGSRTIRVGGFLTEVAVPVDAGIEKLRFLCTSPQKSGLLIDDVRLERPVPMKVVSATAARSVTPVLIGLPGNPVTGLTIEAAGALDPLKVTSIEVSTRGTTDLADVESVTVYFTGSGSWRTRTANVFAGATVFGKPQAPKGSLAFRGEQELRSGANRFWVGFRLRAGANIDHVVDAAVVSVGLSNGKTIRPVAASGPANRLGVALRNGGDQGVHTYRIPGLATTNAGTLIAVYDCRRRGGGDLPGDIDVGMSRSTDGGRTWEPMRVVMDMGGDRKWHYDGIGDPAVLVDRGTGTIWVAATWSHGNRSWRGSGPGLKPEETGQLMLVRSDDDGITWSKPINITRQIKDPAWCFILQGPGKGITMRDGTIVFPAQYQDPPAKKRLPHSTIIYSKDHGETWRVGTGAFDDTTESQVVEIEPGVLMLNCRYNRKSARVVMTTRDMGTTWQKHATSERALIEPRACMASLIDVDGELRKEAGGWLLFSNPNSVRGRHHITIKASRDRGMTWPETHQLLMDEGLGAGYSCMTMVDEDTVGILYEGSQAHLVFQRIPLRDLVAPNDARIIFEQRNLPESAPREGHARNATKYGYRIPSLLVTKKGTILAFAERRLGLHDHAQNDIVLKRSTNGGKSWSDEIVAHEDGMNSINDPLTVQLRCGRILLMFARFPYGRHARDAGWIKMANLGYDDPKANVLTFVCHSDDDGKTWSKPVDISRQVKPPHLLNANTPGAMIQLTRGPHEGRIVTGLWGTLPVIKNGKRSRQWQVVVAHSDDDGSTWKRTEPLADASGKGFPNECQVVEASNGDLVLIARNQGGDLFRKKAISHDGGETWSAFDVDRGLPSVACMGSVIKGPIQPDGRWGLWASFPSNAGRKNGQIAVSRDNGKTWHVVRVIHGPFAYSALQVSADEKSLLCLYESSGYRSMTLIKLPFSDLLPTQSTR